MTMTPSTTPRQFGPSQPPAEGGVLRREDVVVDDFDDLVNEAERAPIGASDFGWLDGRAVEDRPTWRYFDRVAERATDVSTLLEVQAGVGSMIGALPSLPMLSAATDGFPSSVAVAAPRLRSRGVHLVVTSQTRPGLPFANRTFEGQLHGPRRQTALPSSGGGRLGLLPPSVGRRSQTLPGAAP